jgi:hypothetical protein
MCHCEGDVLTPSGITANYLQEFKNTSISVKVLLKYKSLKSTGII